MKSISNRKKHIKMRRAVWERDNYTCAYCGLYMKDLYQQWERGEIKRKEAKITADHVKPLCKGGRSTMGNLVTACRECNTRKGGVENFTKEEDK